jgi:hypothetical protein
MRITSFTGHAKRHGTFRILHEYGGLASAMKGFKDSSATVAEISSAIDEFSEQ